MIKRAKNAVVVISAFLAINIFPAERVEAGVSMSMYCTQYAAFWFPAPNPNVGCKLNWWPGGPAIGGNFSGNYYNCTPNCYVVPGAWDIDYDWRNPAFGFNEKQIATNCLFAVQVSVAALATGVSTDRQNPTPYTIQKGASGNVGYFCPGGPFGTIEMGGSPF
jgi:hypothetical protein